jgi:tetratricopeptide (TPR) repeat protein
MKLSIATQLCSLLLLTNGFACASTYIPEMDDPTIYVRPEFANPRYRFAESEKRKAVSVKLCSEADALRKKGQYEDALKIYQRALVIQPDEGTDLSAIDCLNKLGRPREALVRVNRSLDRHASTSAFKVKIDIEIQMRMFQEALKTCWEYERYFDQDGDSPTLASQVYEAMGNRTEAIEAARNAYFHCARYGFPTEIAKSTLSTLGAAVPTSIPINQTENGKIITNIIKLSQYSEPLLKKDLVSIYKSNFYPMTITSGHQVLDWCSVPFHRDSYFRNVVYQKNLLPYERPFSQLRVDLDLDKCAIQRSDLEKEIGHLEQTESFSDKFSAWQLNEPKSTLVFHFDSQTGLLRDYELRFPIEKKTSTLQPKIAASPPSQEYIKHEIEKRRYRHAADTLMKYWEEYVNSGSGEDAYKRYLATKQLLIDAYRGLELDGVADYIERAPWFFLRIDIGERGAYKELPTLSEFMNKESTVGGAVDGPDSGVYNISVQGYPPVSIYSKSRNFKDIYKVVGPITAGTSKVMTVPSEWIDAMSFQLN